MKTNFDKPYFIMSLGRVTVNEMKLGNCESISLRVVFNRLDLNTFKRFFCIYCDLTASQVKYYKEKHKLINIDSFRVYNRKKALWSCVRVLLNKKTINTDNKIWLNEIVSRSDQEAYNQDLYERFRAWFTDNIDTKYLLKDHAQLAFSVLSHNKTSFNSFYEAIKRQMKKRNEMFGSVVTWGTRMVERIEDGRVSSFYEDDKRIQLFHTIKASPNIKVQEEPNGTYSIIKMSVDYSEPPTIIKAGFTEHGIASRTARSLSCEAS